MITADHGNDPVHHGTDHTREYVPLIAYSKSIRKQMNCQQQKRLLILGQPLQIISSQRCQNTEQAFYLNSNRGNLVGAQFSEAAAYIKQASTYVPTVGLILGSGLGILADEIENPIKIKYEDIPGFPVSTVEGHAGQLVIGTLKGTVVCAMQGRFHFYEGYDMKQVTFPVRVMKEIGIDTCIVTNAAGGVNTSFRPGDLMLITDHINMMGTNPLIGPNDSQGVRFPDMSAPYDKELMALAEETAQRLGISVQQGVYAGMTGPSYENTC